jgi:hypothetical protein
MERLRSDLIRRARSERHADGDAGAPQRQDQVDLESGRSPMTQPPSRLLRIPNLSGHRRNQSSSERNDVTVESPKSPDFRPSGPAFRFPTIGRLLSRGQQEQLPMTEVQQPTPPLPTHSREQRRPSPTNLNTPDPANILLAQMADDGRRRRGSSEQNRTPNAERRPKKEKKFLGCFPWIQSRRTRSMVLRCLVSGLFFGILLAVYLGLAASKTLNTGEQTLMLMLIILLATIFFCYSLLRLCLIVVRGGRPAQRRERDLGHAGANGYAVPNQPIRVVLARDEEAAGEESESSKTTPPAYGLWRSSVRVDPDRLFWQRNDPSNITPRLPEGIVGPRPPSYASDDGISYVVDAVPRSIAPATVETTEMPTHPSEAGRAAARPTW